MSREEQQKDLINRVRTVKGHLGGIEKMIEERKDCKQILIQITAVKAAMDKIGMVVIENYAEECMREALDEPEMLHTKIKDVLKAFTKFSK